MIEAVRVKQQTVLDLGDTSNLRIARFFPGLGVALSNPDSRSAYLGGMYAGRQQKGHPALWVWTSVSDGQSELEYLPVGRYAIRLVMRVALAAYTSPVRLISTRVANSAYSHTAMA